MFRGISRHLKFIPVNDVPKLPALLHFNEIAMIAEQVRQFPHSLYTLVGIRLEPENWPGSLCRYLMQRLPVLAVVERDVEPILRANI